MERESVKPAAMQFVFWMKDMLQSYDWCLVVYISVRRTVSIDDIVKLIDAITKLFNVLIWSGLLLFILIRCGEILVVKAEKLVVQGC